MEAAAVLLLLFVLVGSSSPLSFYGDSVSFKTPRKKKDGTFKVTLYHRQNGRGNCQHQSSFTCENAVCLNETSVQQTDRDDTGQDRWCQSEGHTTATVHTNKTSLSLRASGCCWELDLEGKTTWTSHAELHLGTRSDSHSLNSCPVTTTVASLRVPQNCFSRLHLLAHDPDGDKVRCRFSPQAAIPMNFILHETACTLTHAGEVQIGVHVFELILEDFPTKNLTLTYADGTSVFRDASDLNSPPLCKVKLQFSVEILPPKPNCASGHMLPMFLSQTPSHGDILHATVGQTFQLHANAQAHHASINDFQVSGPQNMTKVFTNSTFGKAEVTLSWRPRPSDLYRIVPVCFTAETSDTQSQMRCVVVMVTQASIVQGKATVHCSPNKMTVALEKASMPDIDKSHLKLSDPSCSLTSNSTHIMGSMSFSTCGTKFEDKGDFIIFKNVINSFELPTTIITRRKTVKIEFSCQFPKTISISNSYSLHRSDYIFTESSFGSFGYTFEIFRDGNFTDVVEPSAYPVEVKLLQTIFMGIQANSELPNVTLFAESCKATPDDNPENALSYYLIRNGCLEDETVKVHSDPDLDVFNFEVQAFKFTGNYDLVYITCSVILCEPGNPFSRCAQGCLKSPSRRRRGLSKETGGHFITQGPLRFVGQAVPSATEDKKDGVKKENDIPAPVSATQGPEDTKSSDEGLKFKKLLASNITTIVFASAFLVSLVLLAVVVRYHTRKRKAEDRNALIVSESEN